MTRFPHVAEVGFLQRFAMRPFNFGWIASGRMNIHLSRLRPRDEEECVRPQGICGIPDLASITSWGGSNSPNGAETLDAQQVSGTLPLFAGAGVGAFRIVSRASSGRAA